MPQNHIPSSPALLGEQLDPVLLALGSSLYVCQGFEQTLIFLLAIVQMEDAGMAEGSFGEAKQSLSRVTLGKLLLRLRQRLELPEVVDIALNDALMARNWITHHFAHETAPEMAHEEGRHAAVLRLTDLKLSVMRADKMASDILDEYLAQFGLELGDLEAQAERIWQAMYLKEAQ